MRGENYNAILETKLFHTTQWLVIRNCKEPKNSNLLEYIL
jgi:hypothetical protein